MAVSNVLGKGGSTYGKHSSKFNFISDSIDMLKNKTTYYDKNMHFGLLIYIKYVIIESSYPYKVYHLYEFYLPDEDIRVNNSDEAYQEIKICY